MTHKSIARASCTVLCLLASHFAVIADPQAPPAAPPQITGTVFTPDGRPVPGAKVTIESMIYSGSVQTTTAETQSDQSGAFTFKLPNSSISLQSYTVLMASTPTGFGVSDQVAGSMSAGGTPAVITIEPLTSVRIHLLDAQGNTVPGIAITPKYLVHQHSAFDLSKKLTPQWAQTTDSSGTIILTGLPQTYTLHMDVDDTQYAPLDNFGQISLAGAAVTPDVTFHLNPAVSISGTVTTSASKVPVVGVRLEAAPVPRNGQSGDATTDSNGHYTFQRLTPGTYIIQVNTNTWGGNPSLTAAARTVTVTGSSSLTGVDIPMVVGARVAGVVRDKITGQPIAGICVILNGPAHPSNMGSDQMVTGADGRFHFRVPAGEQDLIALDQNDTSNNVRDSFVVADSGLRYEDVRMASPPIVAPVTGVVLGPDGKPVAGAEVVKGTQGPGDYTLTTDASGRFTYKQPGLPAKTLLFAHFGSLYTAGGTPTGGTGDVVLHLSIGNSVSFRGVVKDDSGHPVAGASVSLVRWNTARGTGIDTVTATTDASGSYSLGPEYSGFQYSVNATSPGYAGGYTKQVPGAAGQTIVFDPVTVTKADSFIGGTVVDPQGNPVAGATVSVMSNNNLQMLTDSKGHFHFDGVPRNKAILEVQAPDQRFASIEESSGTDENVVKVENMAEEMAEGRRFEATINKDATNHGDGTDANKLLISAEAAAAAGGKQVLLVFHASWCGPCFMLHRFLEDPQVKPIIDAHFVVQDLDIFEHGKNHWENPGGMDIYKRYGGPNSVPYFVVLDKSGKKLGSSIHNGDNMGMPTQPDDVAFFLTTLRASAPTLSAADEAILQAGIKRTSASL